MAGIRTDARSAGRRAKPTERTRRTSVFHANPIRSYHFDITSNRAVSSHQDRRQDVPPRLGAPQPVTVAKVHTQRESQQGKDHFVAYEPESEVVEYTGTDSTYYVTPAVDCGYDMEKFQFPPPESFSTDADLVHLSSHEPAKTNTETVDPRSQNHQLIPLLSPVHTPVRQAPNHKDATYPRIHHTPDIPSHNLHHHHHHQNYTLNTHEHQYGFPALCDLSAFDHHHPSSFPSNHDYHTPNPTLAPALHAPDPRTTNLSGAPSPPTSSSSDAVSISDDTLLALTEPFLMAWCLPQSQAQAQSEAHAAASESTSPSWSWGHETPSSSSLVPFWGNSFLADVGADSLSPVVDDPSDHLEDPFAEITQEFF